MQRNPKMTSFIGGISSLVFAALLTFFVVPLIDNTPGAIIKLLTFLLSFCLAFFISIQFSLLARALEVDKKFDDMQTTINERFNNTLSRFVLDKARDDNIVYIGSVSDVLAYLSINAPQAKDIFNIRATTVPLRDNPRINLDVLYGKNLVEIIVNSIKAGAQWCDLISSGAESRTEKIRSEIKKQSLVERLYTVHRIELKLPVVNVTILDYGSISRNDEVLFGIGANEYDEEVRMFLSNNMLIVRHFYDYFRSIRDYYSEEI